MAEAERMTESGVQSALEEELARCHTHLGVPDVLSADDVNSRSEKVVIALLALVFDPAPGLRCEALPPTLAGPAASHCGRHRPAAPHRPPSPHVRVDKDDVVEMEDLDEQKGDRRGVRMFQSTAALFPPCSAGPCPADPVVRPLPSVDQLASAQGRGGARPGGVHAGRGGAAQGHERSPAWRGVLVAGKPAAQKQVEAAGEPEVRHRRVPAGHGAQPGQHRLGRHFQRCACPVSPDMRLLQRLTCPSRSCPHLRRVLRGQATGSLSSPSCGS